MHNFIGWLHHQLPHKCSSIRNWAIFNFYVWSYSKHPFPISLECYLCHRSCVCFEALFYVSVYPCTNTTLLWYLEFQLFISEDFIEYLSSRVSWLSLDTLPLHSNIKFSLSRISLAVQWLITCSQCRRSMLDPWSGN